MKKTIDETIEITVIDPFVVPDHGTVCIFHIIVEAVSELLKVGKVWENIEGREFVVQEIDKFPNCWSYPFDQIGVVFSAVDGGELPKHGDKLYPSAWKYGLKPSKAYLFERLAFIESLFLQLGASQTDLDSERRNEFGERTIFIYNNEYYSVDVIPFDDKPCFVIEWTDSEEYANAGCLEDVDPFPYDLSDEEILEEIKRAFEIE